MSRLRADKLVNRAATGAPQLTYGAEIPVGYGITGAGDINISGTVTATSVSVNGGSAIPGINTAGTSDFTDVQVGGALTVTGNFTVNGTTTTIDTVNLVIEDKNIGIGTTTTPSNTTADGGGFTIFGGSDGDKTLTWERGSSSFVYSDPNKFKGVLETVSAATTYNSGNNLVLELDVRNATTYTYTIPTGANIGIVSFKNMPAFTGNANGTTITCIFTQMSTTPAGTGNTTGTTGIGTNCFVTGYENGAAVTGISTRALVGSGTTITLSATSNDRDFVSFFVHYTGGTNTTATSYQVYATKNGGFRQGNVGV
jgi:hypothetical protein